MGYNNRIPGLQGEISGTQKRLTGGPGRADGARNELLEVRDELEVARDRLARARAELKQARGGLADRLVELYKADQPDALTVVLEADGFADLLERTEFLERISDQDGAVVRKVRVLKARAEKAERQLAELERKRQVAAETILRRRDDIAATPRPPGLRPGRAAQRAQRPPHASSRSVREHPPATPRRTWQAMEARRPGSAASSPAAARQRRARSGRARAS